MAKHGKMWNHIVNVFQVPATLFLLFVAFSYFVTSDHSLLYTGDGQSNFRRAACQSNMAQLGLALLQYSQDYDNTLPHAATANGYGWREAVYPYMKSTGVYRCPDDTHGGSHDSAENLPKSYAANGVSLGKVEFFDPAQTIMLADTRGFDGEEWNLASPAFLPSTSRKRYAHVSRHWFYDHPPGKLNLLFADGHVQRVAPMDTLEPINLWAGNNALFTGKDLVNAQAILKHAEE